MTGLRNREQLSTAVFYAVLVLLAYLVYQVFRPFLVPVGWAGVLVVVFYPWHSRLEQKWGPTRAATFSTVTVTLILIVPTLLLMTAFVGEGIDAARDMQRAFVEGRLPWIQKAWDWIRQRTPGEAVGGTDLVSLAREAAERVASFLASKLGAILRNAVVFLFDLFVMIFALFYLFRDASSIVRGVRQVLPFDEEHREQLIQQARDLIFASVTSSLIVAAVQGFLGGVMFAALGLGAPVFWGVVMAFFSLLPLVGAWVVWVPAAVWLMLNDQMVRGLVLVGLGAGVVGMVDNFLRPALISGRARLSGLVVFISILGGIGMLGMLGVILGPIVVATAASVFEVYTRRRQPPGEDESGETVRPSRGAVLE
jgi:predicted PurR-regulated permease PerM